MAIDSLVVSGLYRNPAAAPGVTDHARFQFDNLNRDRRERQAECTRAAQELHYPRLHGDSGWRSRFAGLARSMNRVLDHGRSAVQGLRSPRHEFASLGGALAGVPKELGLPATVRFRVVVEGRPRALSASLWDEVYRISREAIINAYLHSRADEIEAEIQYRPTGLRITIRDNGCGIDPRELRWEREDHWGLRGMRERAERIGARLRVLSRVALGTEVELCLPGRYAFAQHGGTAVC